MLGETQGQADAELLSAMYEKELDIACKAVRLASRLCKVRVQSSTMHIFYSSSASLLRFFVSLQKGIVSMDQWLHRIRRIDLDMALVPFSH